MLCTLEGSGIEPFRALLSESLSVKTAQYIPESVADL